MGNEAANASLKDAADFQSATFAVGLNFDLKSIALSKRFAVLLRDDRKMKIGVFAKGWDVDETITPVGNFDDVCFITGRGTGSDEAVNLRDG